jgi:FMN phosphatase YigB (HAD superfamily)
MSPAILFDLDDTLLQTNMGAFLPAYFESLGQHMAHLVNPEALRNQLVQAVRAMESNQDPGLPLKTVFDQHFYAPLGATEDEWRQVLDAFYKTKFPRLNAIVNRRPEALNLIHWCKEKGLDMAIATNPLFPRTATLQRMAWAGLDPKDFIFVSTYEGFHFTKPNLSYYAEAIGRLGWPEGPIPMIGDNLTHDLLPMKQMGHPTFWIQPEDTESQQLTGDLKDVKAFLNGLPSDSKPEIADDPEVWEAILRATPAVLDTWIKTAPDEIWKKRPEAHEWSLVEIFWHLADMEAEITLPQWEQLFQTPDQPLPAVDTEAWAETRDYLSRRPEAAFERFIQARKKSLDWIIRLREANRFSHRLHHPVFTHTTIQELVRFSCRHDIVHIRQLRNLLNIYKIF